MATGEKLRPDSASPKLEVSEVRPGLWKVKLAQGRGLLKVGIEKKHGDANSLFLELNSSRKFEIGNDCDTCHFWFKCLSEPRLGAQKKIANLSKVMGLKPLDAQNLHELSPLLEILEKGEYYVFQHQARLAGPYAPDDETSYVFNTEFQELWDIDDPAQEGLLSDWEHYEGTKPRLYRHDGLMEKQFDFVIPLVPKGGLNEEYVKLYQQMIAGGDRSRILLFGMLQRPVPESVRQGHAKNLHSFFAGFVLDGHHKLAAYRRAGVAAPFLVVLSYKASKYALLKDEGGTPRARLEERLASLSA